MIRPIALKGFEVWNEKQYLYHMRDILFHGREKTDRTGTGTLSLFGAQTAYDLKRSFPLITTKKMSWKIVCEELIWMLEGNTNANVLKDKGVNIWNAWADKDGELGPIYGRQWRDFNGQGIDQIKDCITQLQTNPDSRRIIVSAWNPVQLDNMALPPCHSFFQFYSSPMTDLERCRYYCDHVEDVPEYWKDPAPTLAKANKANVPTRWLSCQLYQRSADIFLGVPYNIAFYSLLTLIMAKLTGHAPDEFVHSLGDYHLYTNHVEQAKEQLERKPLHPPMVHISDEVMQHPDLYGLTPDMFVLDDYVCHGAIKAEVAV